MMFEKLNIVTNFGAFKAKFLLNSILILFGKHGIPTNGFTLYGEPVDLVNVVTILRKSNRQTFLLVGQGFEIDLASIHRYEIDILSIKAEIPSTILWDDWISSIEGVTKIIEAWVVNAEYDYWQNAFDPVQFTSQGRQWEHLPMISNGLPPPLEKTIVDTSQNLGRRILRIGYVEAIGYLMWLGDKFWSLSGANKNDVLKQHWINNQILENGLLRIQIGNNSFSSDEGSEGVDQQQLRQLLFPNKDASI